MRETKNAKGISDFQGKPIKNGQVKQVAKINNDVIILDKNRASEDGSKNSSGMETYGHAQRFFLNARQAVQIIPDCVPTWGSQSWLLAAQARWRFWRAAGQHCFLCGVQRPEKHCKNYLIDKFITNSPNLHDNNEIIKSNHFCISFMCTLIPYSTMVRLTLFHYILSRWYKREHISF